MRSGSMIGRSHKIESETLSTGISASGLTVNVVRDSVNEINVYLIDFNAPLSDRLIDKTPHGYLGEDGAQTIAAEWMTR